MIQFCPDASKLEAANIGVLLYCPDKNFIKAKVARRNKRVAQFFGRTSFDPERLKAFKRAFQTRFEVDRVAFRTIADVEQFIATRANQIRMTPLRPMRSMNPQADLETLFNDLVGGPVYQRSPRIPFPELDSALRQPTFERRIEFDRMVEVPTLRKKLAIPYAYKNGVLNLVKPCEFSGSQDQAIRRAEVLAVDGHLLHKHSVSLEIPMQLVVVSRFAPGLSDVRKRVVSLFGELQVQHWAFEEIDRLIEKVGTEARP
jgi:hypothetical protein